MQSQSIISQLRSTPIVAYASEYSDSRRLDVNEDVDEEAQVSALRHIGEFFMLIVAISAILFVLMSIQIWYRKLGMQNVDVNTLESWDFGDDTTLKTEEGVWQPGNNAKRGYAQIPQDLDRDRRR